MGTVPNYKFVGEYVKSQFERGRNALEEGVYDRAIELFSSALRARGMNPEIEAEIRCSLSEAYEEDANGKQALEAIVKYESHPARELLPAILQSLVWLRMGLAYDRHPKAISYLKTSLKLAEELGEASAIGRAHLALGRSYLKVDEYHIAHDHLDLAAQNFRLIGDRRLLAQCGLANGSVLLREGKHKEAMGIFESAERLISDKPYHSLLGHIMQNSAVTKGLQQRGFEAIAYQERAIEYFERAGQRRSLVAALNNLGFYSFPLGEVDRAESDWQRALGLAHELGYPQTEAMSLDGLAQIDILRGRYAAAKEKLDNALGLAKSLKSKWYESQVRHSLTRLFLDSGEIQNGLSEATIAFELAEQTGDEHGVQLAHLLLCEARILNGQLEKAVSLIGKVEKKLETIADLMLLGLSRRLRSIILTLQGQNEESTAAAAQSVSAFEALGNKYQVALSRIELAKGLLKSADSTATREVLDRARASLESLGAEADLKKVLRLLRDCRDEPKSSSLVPRLSLTCAERLLDAVVARDLLVHELVSVLQGIPEVRRIAAIEIAKGGLRSVIISHGWNSDDLHQLFLSNKLDNSVPTLEGCVTKYWLDPERDDLKERAALLIETANSDSNDQIRLFVRLAQQGLELSVLRHDRQPKLVETAALGNELADSVGLLIGSAAMRQVIEAIHRIRSSDVTVLITGESGTGKELVARAVHRESARRDKAFVPFNCTTATRDLADSLLFGHRRGAFTGAGEDRQGVVRAADGGTLFLDEIGDLAIEVQPKLLRFLQEGEVQPLGTERPFKVDVRIVAATNAELEQLVEQGRFREDLYHRLNVIRLRVPALRERREEVPILARHFLTRFAQESRKRLALSEEATDLLQVYHWPGNVRQLSNEVRRIVALAEEGATITHKHLSTEIVGPLRSKIEPFVGQSLETPDGVVIDVKQPLSDAVSQLEREMLLTALRQNKGNLSRTARQLGLTRRGLHLKRERLGIQDLADDGT